MQQAAEKTAAQEQICADDHKQVVSRLKAKLKASEASARASRQAAAQVDGSQHEVQAQLDSLQHKQGAPLTAAAALSVAHSPGCKLQHAVGSTDDVFGSGLCAESSNLQPPPQASSWRQSHDAQHLSLQALRESLQATQERNAELGAAVMTMQEQLAAADTRTSQLECDASCLQQQLAMLAAVPGAKPASSKQQPSANDGAGASECSLKDSSPAEHALPADSLAADPLAPDSLAAESLS